MMKLPPLRLEAGETAEEYKVRYENEWFLARTEYRKLNLDPQSGAFSYDEVEQECKISYDSADGRAVFVARFETDNELTGYMKLKLWVSAADGEHMDLFIGVKNWMPAVKRYIFTP